MQPIDIRKHIRDANAGTITKKAAIAFYAFSTTLAWAAIVGMALFLKA